VTVDLNENPQYSFFFSAGSPHPDADGRTRLPNTMGSSSLCAPTTTSKSEDRSEQLNRDYSPVFLIDLLLGRSKLDDIRLPLQVIWNSNSYVRANRINAKSMILTFHALVRCHDWNAVLLQVPMHQG
jgi:hypothetical protein